MITLVINSTSKIDSYFISCSSEGIIIPDAVAMSSIFASLRMKHDVLILTKNFIPEADFTKRFSFGDDFIHLSPRFLRFLTENYSRQTLEFPEFKAFLTTSK